MQRSAIVRSGLLALAAVLGLASCAQSGDTVSKVKIFRLDPKARSRGVDPAIAFEYRHRLHGAITAEEFAERAGNYYTAFWSVMDRSQPVTVRFEYKQAATGSKVNVIEQEVAEPKRSNITEFQVTGPAYATGGKIVAWRIVLKRGKEELATRDSYLWK